MQRETTLQLRKRQRRNAEQSVATECYDAIDRASPHERQSAKREYHDTTRKIECHDAKKELRDAKGQSATMLNDRAS